MFYPCCHQSQLSQALKSIKKVQEITTNITQTIINRATQAQTIIFNILIKAFNFMNLILVSVNLIYSRLSIPNSKWFPLPQTFSIRTEKEKRERESSPKVCHAWNSLQLPPLSPLSSMALSPPSQVVADREKPEKKMEESREKSEKWRWREKWRVICWWGNEKLRTKWGEMVWWWWRNESDDFCWWGEKVKREWRVMVKMIGDGEDKEEGVYIYIISGWG